MKRAFPASFAVFLLLLLALSGCRSGGDLTQPETQRRFGVRMAKMNLWREAMFRFEREVQIQPENAMAHNNLAVAAEANGDFELAAKEYREALRLDRSNQYIQKNYSRFVEFSQKSRKRETPASPARAAAPAAPGTTAAEPAAPPAEPPGAPPESAAAPAPAEPGPAPAPGPVTPPVVPAPEPVPPPAETAPPSEVPPPADPATPPPATTTNPPGGAA